MNLRVFIPLVLALFIPATASALCGDVCEVSIRPHIVAVEIPLEGWVFTDANAVTVDVIDEPRFGTWVGEVYTPSAAFQEMGGDRIRIKVTETATDTETLHTLLIKVAGIVVTESYSENFDDTAGDPAALEPEWEVIDPTNSLDITDINPLTGTYSLKVNYSSAQPGNQNIQQGSDETGKHGIDQMSGSAVINASPPTNVFEDWNTTFLQLEDYVTVRLLYENGFYKIQATVDNLNCPITPCETPKQTVVAGRNYRVRASIGAQGIQHPLVENSYSFDLIIKEMGATWEARHQIDDLDPLVNRSILDPNLTLGAFNSSGNNSVVVHYDDVEYVEGSLLPSDLSTLTEDFSDGTWSNEWIGVGPLSTATGFRSGNNGFFSVNDNWHGLISMHDIHSQGSEAYWMDLAPSGGSVMWAHLKFGSAATGIGAWGHFRVLEGQNAAGTVFLLMQVRLDSSLQPQIRARVRDGSGVMKTTGWIDIVNSRAEIDVAWDGPAGTLRLRVDDQVNEVLDLVPTSAYQLDRISIGAGSLFTGLPAIDQTSRVFYDDFVLFYQEQ